MDTIESKVQQLKELSKKKEKLEKIKQDIADILGNADMNEKLQIVKKMSKIKPEDDNQKLNLGFILPNIVKENYGPEIERKIPKKVEPIEPIAEEVKPEIETVIEPVVKEPFIPAFIKQMEPVKPKIEKVEASPERIKILQKLHKYLPAEFFE